MNKLFILGSGACGFLRMHYLLKTNGIDIRYKGGRAKYQNSFSTWDECLGLIWEGRKLSREERIRRTHSYLKRLTNAGDICHYALPYIAEILALEPTAKFLCLRGEKEHSIRSLATHWGYRNPVFSKERRMGVGYQRYAIPQFPDYSDAADELEATQRYWEEYYALAEEMASRFPEQFLIIDAPRFFSNEAYQRDVLAFAGLNIPYWHSPVDFNAWDTSTTLCGGLGNNLFQLGEVISFCEKQKLPKPFFGTWDLWQGGKLFPFHYNSDKLLSGHTGSEEQIQAVFPNLNWRTRLKATFDTKFIVNDMFRFSEIDPKTIPTVLHAFAFSEPLQKSLREKYAALFAKPNVSLHLRFWGLAADTHGNLLIPDSFYIRCFEQFPPETDILVFADKNDLAAKKIQRFKSLTNRNHRFTLIEEDAFSSLCLMSLCDNNILHNSTLSYWSAFLNTKKGRRVLYHKNFALSHSPNMILEKDWERFD